MVRLNYKNKNYANHKGNKMILKKIKKFKNNERFKSNIYLKLIFIYKKAIKQT